MFDYYRYMLLSSNSISRKLESPSSVSNLMLRTDGFKKIVKGLSYKQSFTVKNNHIGSYSSLGKRVPSK